MGRIVFLMEEPSMHETLRAVLPKLYPTWKEEVNWVPIVFPGKQALEKGMESKLRGWQEPGIRFVILRDNDNGDCLALKTRLQQKAASRPSSEVLIRIVCQELESWFLGDLNAIRTAYPRSRVSPDRIPAKYRAPDTVANASEELEKLTQTKAKVIRAQKIARAMAPTENKSRSFHALIDGLHRLVAENPQ